MKESLLNWTIALVCMFICFVAAEAMRIEMYYSIPSIIAAALLMRWAIYRDNFSNDPYWRS